MPEVRGYHHVNLSVTDADASAAWYERVLGLAVLQVGDVGGMQKVVLSGPSGMLLGLTSHKVAGGGDAFDERRTGLDHVALTVAGPEALDDWAHRLDQLGVAHSGVKPSPFGSLITLRDPDNVQIELFAPHSPAPAG